MNEVITMFQERYLDEVIDTPNGEATILNIYTDIGIQLTVFGVSYGNDPSNTKKHSLKDIIQYLIAHDKKYSREWTKSK